MEKQIDSISIFFESGKYNITDKSKLKARLDKLTKPNLGKIQVTGFTDSIGDLKSNKFLASQRMISVIELINSSSLRTLVIDTVNMNESKEKQLGNMANYRRVDIIVYKTELNIDFQKPIQLKIEFEAGSNILTRSSKPALENLYTVLKLDTTLQVKLYGHVCCMGDYDMSLLRALEVK